MPATQDELHLVYASDANYVRYIEVALRSAYAKASRPSDLVVHVLDCGIPDEVWIPFAKRLESILPSSSHLVRHVIDMAQFSGLKTWTNGTLALYARLNLPTLLQDLDWCVYADGDTLFLADPFELQAFQDEHIALKGFVCPGAAQNFELPWFKQNDVHLDVNTYLCSGFLLMNLKWFREHDAEASCFRFMQEHPNPPFPDQDTLNAVCLGFTAGLPDGWGTYGFLCWKYPIDFYKCIHYAHSLPWKSRFLWRVGYLDNAAVWVYAARAMTGYSIRELTGIAPWQWALWRTYTRLMGASVTFASYLPFVGRYFARYRVLFFTHAERRRFFSPAFWKPQTA